MPLDEPPVETLGRPFIIFLFRGANGSSHEPKAGRVDENARTCHKALADKPIDNLVAALGAAAWEGAGINRVAGDILRFWKALSSAKAELLCLIVSKFLVHGHKQLDGVGGTGDFFSFSFRCVSKERMEKKSKKCIGHDHVRSLGQISPVLLPHLMR